MSRASWRKQTFASQKKSLRIRNPPSWCNITYIYISWKWNSDPCSWIICLYYFWQADTQCLWPFAAFDAEQKWNLTWLWSYRYTWRQSKRNSSTGVFEQQTWICILSASFSNNQVKSSDFFSIKLRFRSHTKSKVIQLFSLLQICSIFKLIDEDSTTKPEPVTTKNDHGLLEALDSIV